MIEISHLTKRYHDRPVLSDITLSMQDTGLLYIIGKSGAGKTTLLSLIGCIDETYEGSICFNKKELKNMTEEEKADYRFQHVSFVFQDYCSLEEETVEENLMKSLDITNLSKEEKKRKLLSVLERVGLKEKKKMKFKDASGGEKKRLSLARGLLRDSDILLVDEPVSSLDVTLRKEITSILEEESKKRLVFIITHELDSIPSSATVYELVDGVLCLRKKGEEENKTKTRKKAERRNYPLSAQLNSALSFFEAHARFMSIVFFSLTLALFSSSFSFQLSGNVSSSLVSSFSKYMKDNTMVIENKEQGIKRANYEIASQEELSHYCLAYPDMVICQEDFYLTSLNEVFLNSQTIKARYQDSSYTLKKFSADSILNYSLPEEEGLQEKVKNYKKEEIALLLDEDSLFGMYYLLFSRKPKEIDEKEINEINGALSYKVVSFEFLFYVSEWKYQLNHSFRIRNVYPSTICKVVIPEKGFSSYFVKEILHFKERYEEEKGEYPPWTLIKCKGLRIKKDRIVDFFFSFLKDEQKELTLEILKQSSYFIDEKMQTYNHIGVYKDYRNRISVSDIYGIYNENRDFLSALSFSSPMYTYTASGYISGFLSPYFFSRYKDKLNRIQDNNAYSSYDLGSFQGSLIETENGVIKADLLSSMDGNGLVFHSMEEQSLLYGNAPTKSDEIGISKKMAEELFPLSSDSIGEKLYVLTLEKTKKENDRYHHCFIEGELTISAVYDDDSLSLYQDPLFPLAYSFFLTHPNKDSFYIDNVTMRVDFDKVTKEGCERMMTKDRKYQVSFPMYEMIKEIEKTLKLLSEVFFSLSLISFLSSAFLMFLSFFLIMKKDRKNIGVMLALGYRKKEISLYYFLLIGLLSLFSYLNSFVFSAITEKTIKNSLRLTLNSYQGSIRPFLLSFFEMIVLGLIVFILLAVQIRKITPKEALKSNDL